MDADLIVEVGRLVAPLDVKRAEETSEDISLGLGLGSESGHALGMCRASVMKHSVQACGLACWKKTDEVLLMFRCV